MDKETFFKLVGLLGLTYNELSAESGYSVNTINSIRNGRLKVSPRMEQFIKLKIQQMAANNDPALDFIFETLGR